MLFGEFVEGTGCRETEYNYQVYKELEIIYMHTDCTKEHIYEMGKKLVDNNKSEEEQRIEAEIREQIEEAKREAKWWQNRVKAEQCMLVNETDEDWKKELKASIKLHNRYVKECKQKIKELKFILG